MFKTMLIIVVFFVSSPSDFTVLQSDPLSYFRTAENIASLQNLSNSERSDIRHLYVLSAVLDSSLRENAILGLLHIEKDPALKRVLHSMRSNSVILLVPEVALKKDSPLLLQSNSAEDLCKTITSIRFGKKISSEQLQALRPWRYLFPKVFDRIVPNKVGKKLQSETDFHSTLRVELAILGGPTVWSADYIDSGGIPMSFTVNDDLATLFQIDPTKTIRKNGRWVSN